MNVYYGLIVEQPTAIPIALSPAAAGLVLDTSTTTPGLLSNDVIVPAAAVLALSSVAPGASVSDINLPAAAALVLSTTTPAAIGNSVKIPAAATLALTTVAPVVLGNTIETAPAATLALSGPAPSVVWTQNWALTPAVAALTLTTTTPTVALTTNPGLHQAHFRFRTDTLVVDSTPTWGAAEDVSTGFNPGTATFRLRVQVSNSGLAASAAPFSLYVSKNAGAYQLVSTVSAMGVKSADASVSVDEAPITVQDL